MARLVSRSQKSQFFRYFMLFRSKRCNVIKRVNLQSLTMTSHWQTTFFLGIQCILGAMAIPLGKYIREISNAQQNEIPPTTTLMSTITSSSNVTQKTVDKTMMMAGINFKQPHLQESKC
jgi:hypothetical protein